MRRGEVRQEDAIQTTAEQVTVTDRAARRIAEIVASELATPMLRVSAEGGGCSGFQYRFDLVAASDAEDVVIEKAGARADRPGVAAIPRGSQIDFVDDLIGASFKINNPNATASCGCGTSFSI